MPAPGPGEARVRQTAIGVNFIDVYFRTGLYKAPQLPFMPGQEGAGVVEAVGPGVTEVAVGDRVAYAGLPGVVRRGAARAGRAPREAAAGDRRPDGGRDDAEGDDGGGTCCCAARASDAGDTILFHAAAGGVGSIACQWAKHLGPARDRHGGRPGEGRARARRTAATTSSTTTRKTSSPA